MKQGKKHDNYWMSLSDMMSALMIIFLFVAIAFMMQIQHQQKQLKEIIVEYKETRDEIQQALLEEFAKDFKKWNAELKPDLSIRFGEEILFDAGSDVVKRDFREILDDFFPRYIRILSADKYRKVIQEIRIEGHTSSEWGGVPPRSLEAYFGNMELSQRRTRKVLEYVMRLPALETKGERDWLVSKLTANGLSFGQPIEEDGRESYEKSRRVEFRVRTNAEKKMGELEEKS